MFPGGFNLPLWVAQEKGYLAHRALAVQLTPTPSSVFQLTHLIAGEFDIAMTAMDNVMAYDEGQGEVVAPGRPDLFAFMGGDSGFLRLIVKPEIQTYADLRGKTLSVDALSTGYAFVLRKMLEVNGLGPKNTRSFPPAACLNGGKPCCGASTPARCS
ncbi:MAG TPA: ABC transporter substrate-binding protein [bacterium]|nr:ABC transporter substrate-binding protein [bacterium]